LRRPRRRDSASSRGIHSSFRVLSIRRVSRLWVREPAAPLAFSSALRDSVSKCRLDPVPNQTRPLVDFSVPPESCPVVPSRSRRRSGGIGSSLGLSLPSTLPGTGGPLSAGLAHPATFRLQGLATLLTVFSPRNLAGPVSSRQRSWDSSLRSFPFPQGGGGVSTTAEPAGR
jgi:hypothetical protein